MALRMFSIYPGLGGAVILAVLLKASKFKETDGPTYSDSLHAAIALATDNNL